MDKEDMVSIAVARINTMQLLTRLEQLRSCEFQEDIDAQCVSLLKILGRIRTEVRTTQKRRYGKPSVNSFDGLK